MKKVLSLLLSGALAFSVLALPAFADTETATAERSGIHESIYFHADFDDVEEGALPEGFLQAEDGTGQIVKNSDGNQVLQLGYSGGESRVVVELPDVDGNYVFEADITFVETATDAAWAGLLSRVQSDDSYYRMAARFDPTGEDGIHIAKSADGALELLSEGAAPELEFEKGKTYHWKMALHEDMILAIIDDVPVLVSGQAGDFRDGGIGIAAYGAVVQVDNLLVTALDEGFITPLASFTSFAAPKILSSSMVNAPTVITYGVEDLTDLANIVADSVSSTVYVELVTEDGGLTVYSGDNRLGTLDEFFNVAHGRVLTMLQVEDEETADAFAEFISANGSKDMHIASTDEELLRSFRAQATATRASLILPDEELTLEQAYDYVQRANTAWAKSVILRPGAADKYTVEKMQQLLMTVMVISDDTVTGHHEAITSGATSILTADPEGLKEAATLYTGNSLVRRPFIIGHRGTPGSAPENTMVGYRMSYDDFGSDMIETDVYLTKDGEVIILHDDYFSRTTDIGTTTAITDEEVAATGRTRSTLRPKDLTLEQIKRLDAGTWYGTEFAGEPIPTLKELLEDIKGKDVVLFLELKDNSEGIEQATVDTILSLGEEMVNQVGIITFNTKSITIMNEIYPGFACGNLNAVTPSLTNIGTTVDRILNATLPMNATYNPSNLLFNQNQMRYLNARGMTAWPWTYNSASTHRSHLGFGVSGLTTNYADWTKDSVMGLYVEDRRRTVEPGGNLEVTVDTITNNGQDAGLPTEMIVLEGEDLIQVSGNTVTALEEGTAAVMFKVAVPAQNGHNAHNIYSQPVVIHIGEEEEIPVESINLNAGSLNMLPIGKTLELNPTILPENATDKAVTYTSNNPNVASVDEDGVVTAHKTGTALITATASNGKVSKTTVRVTY